jgi:hypothetical protein
MKNFDQFHDGSLDGLLIDQTSVWVFISTAEKQPFVVTAFDVVALAADGFRAGNIIFDVLTRQNGELTLGDIIEVYGLSGVNRDDQAQTLLMKAQEQNLMILEINPSYGASILVMSKSVELLSRHEWAERYSAHAVR